MDVADVSIESLESRLLLSPTPKLGSPMVSGVVGSELENESLPVSGCCAAPGMQCKILSMLVILVVSLLTGVLLLEGSQQCGPPRSSRDRIAYLVLTGMRMLFRVQVLGIFPASTSEVKEFDRLGGDELAWYCGAGAFVGDNGREEVDDCDGWCLCLMS